MKKEDYMKLRKERLAELLAERDARDQLMRMPPLQVPAWEPSCFSGGPCTNPHHDCINCPRQYTGGRYTITSTNNDDLNNGKGK